MNKIGLINAWEDEQAYNDILDIMDQMEREGNVFAGKEERMLMSAINLLIVYDGEPAGFIYATPEARYPNGLFIDMGILEEYRDLGIGKEVIDEIMRIPLKHRFFIGETKVDNKSSNSVGRSLGALIGEYENKVYYLFPKNRLREFKRFNKDHRFEEAISHSTQSSRDIMRDIMNNDNYRKVEKVKKLTY